MNQPSEVLTSNNSTGTTKTHTRASPEYQVHSHANQFEWMVFNKQATSEGRCAVRPAIIGSAMSVTISLAALYFQDTSRKRSRTSIESLYHEKGFKSLIHTFWATLHGNSSVATASHAVHGRPVKYLSKLAKPSRKKKWQMLNWKLHIILIIYL